MDAAVNQVMENALLQAAQKIEDNLDDQIHKMDNLDEDDLDRLRQEKLKQMQKSREKREQWMRQGHGEYNHIETEKEFFAAMKGEARMVCHFYRNNWPCKVMDKHLGILCKQHIECKFVKIDAEKSPYLTEKLKIWMLPTLALVKNEKVVDYVVGLDDMGGREDFPTEALAARLAAASVIEYHEGDRVNQSTGPKSGIRKAEHLLKQDDDEDSDFD